jgi:CMP/dCMP kinase
VNAMERMVIDSRMAFHFVTNAIKVTLVIDPEVAVARVMGANRAEETYATVDIARHAIAERNRLERERYFKLYGVNTHDLANYDIVVNTSVMSIDEVVSTLVTQIRAVQEKRASARC